MPPRIAADRREKRRDDALEERRKRNANKSHVYSLTKTFPVPFHLRPHRSPSIPLPGVGSSRRRATLFAPRISPPTMVALLMATQQNQQQPRILFLVDEGGTALDPKPSALRTSIHSRSDRVVPYSDSERLIANSDLREKTIIETGSDHRLVDPQSLQVLVQTCQSLVL